MLKLPCGNVSHQPIYIFFLSGNSLKHAFNSFTRETVMKNTECISCEAGTYYPKVKGSGPCLDCPLGAYCPTSKLGSPQLCPIGYYSTSIKASSFGVCLPCNPGFFSAAPGSTGCAQCPLGYYCPGKSDKILCPIGR